MTDKVMSSGNWPAGASMQGWRFGTKALGRLLLPCCAYLIAPSVSAEPETGHCIASEVQPESIDLDQPRGQLARQVDLVIPDGARIGQIRIVRRPIFDVSDPEQDNLLYRTLNALNTPTWKSALRAQLVFEEGEVYEPDIIAESERVLRQHEYQIGRAHV